MPQAGEIVIEERIAARDCRHGHLARKCDLCYLEGRDAEASCLLSACLPSLERHLRHHRRAATKDNPFTSYHETRVLQLAALIGQVREFLPWSSPGAEG